MSGHGRHHEGTTLRPPVGDVRDTNLPGLLPSRPRASQCRPRASQCRPRAAGFACRHRGRLAVTRGRLASWRHGSRYPPQRCGGSLPPWCGQACHPVRCGHGSLRRARCGTQDETRRRPRSGGGRDTRPQRPGCSEAHRSPRTCCLDTRRSKRPGWSLAVRLRRPGGSSRGSRRSRAPTAHGGPGPSWYPSARHRRPAYECYVPPGSWRASGNRPRPRSDLPGEHLHRPRRVRDPGRRRQLPAVPGHSYQRAWRPSKPSGSRYRLPDSSASRIPRPRSSTSSFNTTQTSEEGRSTISGATLFKTCPAASYSPTRSPAQYHRR